MDTLNLATNARMLDPLNPLDFFSRPRQTPLSLNPIGTSLKGVDGAGSRSSGLLGSKSAGTSSRRPTHNAGWVVTAEEDLSMVTPSVGAPPRPETTSSLAPALEAPWKSSVTHDTQMWSMLEWN
eukprot:3354875-Amphidinium_carterae.2